MKYNILSILFILISFSAYSQRNNTPLTVTISSGIICRTGECKTLTTAVDGGTPPYKYLWTTGETTSSKIVCLPGLPYKMTVHIEDAVGATATDTVEVKYGEVVNMPIHQTSLLCGENSCTSLVASGAAYYQWTSPVSSIASTINICPSKTTTYEVIGTSLEGCKDTVLYEAIVHPAPIINAITGRDTICLGDTVKLTVFSTSLSKCTYMWNPGVVIGNPIFINPSTTQTETVTVTDSIGCAVEGTFTIHVIKCTNDVLEQPIEKMSLKVYPNPFETSTIISFSNEQKNATLKVIDVPGKEVRTIHFSGRQVQLDKNELKPGIYFILVRSEEQRSRSQKIIIR